MKAEVRSTWAVAPLILLVAMTVAGCRTVLNAEFDRYTAGAVVPNGGLNGSPTGDTVTYSTTGDSVSPTIIHLGTTAGRGNHAQFEDVRGTQTISFVSRNFTASGDDKHSATWNGRMSGTLNSELTVEFKNGNGVAFCGVTFSNGDVVIDGTTRGNYVLDRAHSVVMTANKTAGECSILVSGTSGGPWATTFATAWAGNNRRLDFVFSDADSNSIYQIDSVLLTRPGE